MIREMLELGLSREGFEVRTAADGLAALDVVRGFDPEIIIPTHDAKIDGLALLHGCARSPRLRS